MKRVRGFGYVGDDVDDDEWEDEESPYPEYGHAYASRSEYLAIRAYACPRCKRVLFEGDIDLHGVIFIKCRRCKRKVGIETQPTVQRIGFV